MDETIRQYLAKIGKKGGTARAAKHSAEELRKWGRKGGRPRKKEKEK